MADTQYQFEQNGSGETLFGTKAEIAAGNYTKVTAKGEFFQYINGVEHFIEVGPKPHGALRLATQVDQVFTQTQWDKINFDALSVQKGEITVDVPNKTITVGKDGWYNVVIGINAVFGGADNFSVMVYVNGNPYSPTPTNRAGEGADDEVLINWVSAVELQAGDVVDLRGQNAPTGSGNLNLHMKRLFFSVKYDD